MSNKPMCLCSFVPRLAGSANSARNGKWRGRRKHFVAFLQRSHFRDRFEHYNTLWSCVWLELLCTRFPRSVVAQRFAGSSRKKPVFYNEAFLRRWTKMACDERVPARFCGPHRPSSSCSSSSSMWSACPATRRGDHPRHALQHLQFIWARFCSLRSVSIEFSPSATWKRFSFVGDLISTYGAVADELEVFHFILQPSAVLHCQ